MGPWQIIGWCIVAALVLILAVLALSVVIGLFTSAHEMWLRVREVRRKRKVALATTPCAGQVWLWRFRGYAGKAIYVYIRVTAVDSGTVIIEPCDRQARLASRLPSYLSLSMWRVHIQTCDLTYAE